MSIIVVEGFETVGQTTGSGDAANVTARLALRYSVGGSVFLVDDYESSGYAMEASGYLDSIVETAYFSGSPSGNTYVQGCRYHVPDTSVRDFYVMRAKESFGWHATLWISGGTDLKVSDGYGNLRATAAGVITPGSWHHLEWKWKVASGGAGSAEVYLDGVQVINYTGNLYYFGTGVTGVGWGGTFTTGPGPSGTGDDYIAIDDCWLAEVDGTTPNDFLGNSVRIESLPPNGDDTVQWTTSTGTTHYTLVDENPASSTDNVYTSTDAEVEMFDMTNTTEAKNIYAVKVEVEAIDDIDAGANNIDVRIDSGGTVSETNHNVTNTGAYAVFTHLEGAVDPDTSSAWTKTGINALKIGIQYNT
jgi:hypothetical protein